MPGAERRSAMARVVLAAPAGSSGQSDIGQARQAARRLSGTGIATACRCLRVCPGGVSGCSSMGVAPRPGQPTRFLGNPLALPRSLMVPGRPDPGASFLREWPPSPMRWTSMHIHGLRLQMPGRRRPPFHPLGRRSLRKRHGRGVLRHPRAAGSAPFLRPGRAAFMAVFARIEPSTIRPGAMWPWAVSRPTTRRPEPWPTTTDP